MATFNVDLNYLFLLLILCIPAAVFLFPVFWRLRERARLIEVARTAVERGAPVPVELLARMQTGSTTGSAERDFRNGLILIAVAIGLAVFGLGLPSSLEALFFAQGPAVSYGSQGSALSTAIAAAAALPGMIGIALVLLSRFQKRSKGD